MPLFDMTYKRLPVAQNAENYNDFQRNIYSKAYLNSYINKAMLLSFLLLISIRLHFIFSNVTIMF